MQSNTLSSENQYFTITNLELQYCTYLIQKQPSCKKKCAAPKKAIVKKRCEIQGGGQEMAAMVGQ